MHHFLWILAATWLLACGDRAPPQPDAGDSAPSPTQPAVQPGIEPQPAPTPEPAPAADPLQAMTAVAVAALARSDDAAGEYAQACALCHGPKGQGKRALGVPSIAGAPAWYLVQQLERFREGLRGDHPEDAPGRAMAEVARALQPGSLRPLATHIRAMPPLATVRTVAGDPAQGRLVYAEQCMECHRYNGAGEQLFKSSPLTLFQDWYLQREFEEFRVGKRGRHKADVPGGKMRVVAQFLDQKSIQDVLAYISELARRHPPGR